MANTEQTIHALQLTKGDVKELYEILESINDSITNEELNDCNKVLQDIPWEMKPGEDKRRFEELLTQGTYDGLDQVEMDEFMDMVSKDGPIHVYHLVRRAELALERLKPVIDSI